jgi:putative endonuclease
MHYCYIIRSESSASQLYFGSTSNLKNRLKAHNSGQSIHTKKYVPWVVIWYGAFSTRKEAEKFERYLKTASGKAFMRKRLL